MEHFEISVPEKESEELPENLQMTENNISNNNKSTLLKRKRQSRTFTIQNILKATLHATIPFTSQNPYHISLHTCQLHTS